MKSQEQQYTQKIQDKKFEYLIENYKEICYNIKDSKSKYREHDDIVRIMAVRELIYWVKTEYRSFFQRRIHTNHARYSL